MSDPKVPERCSLRRAKALTGLSDAALRPLMGGGYRNVAISDLERLMQRPIDLAAWDKATLAISHQAMMQDAS